jgi:recombination protein U
LQNEGKKFEEDFKKSIDEDKIYFYRLRDSGSAFGNGNDSCRFSTSNEYDCFIYLQPNFFPFELKSTQGTSMSIQKDKTEKSKMIKLHQIEGLTRASKYEGIYAGFILNFRDIEHTYWLDIKDFNRFNETTDKKSINEKDIVESGGILIPQEKKKVRYRYFINKMIEMIRES